MNTAVKYRTGEVMAKGDRVRIGALDAVVDFIMTRNSPGWDEWKEIGEGVMVDRPHGGNLYIRIDHEALVFVSRQTTKA